MKTNINKGLKKLEDILFEPQKKETNFPISLSKYHQQLSLIIWNTVKKKCFKNYNLWALERDKKGKLVGRKLPENYKSVQIYSYSKKSPKGLTLEMLSNLEYILIKEIKKELKKYKEKDLLVVRPSQLWEDSREYLLSVILYIGKRKISPRAQRGDKEKTKGISSDREIQKKSL